MFFIFAVIYTIVFFVVYLFVKSEDALLISFIPAILIFWWLKRSTSGAETGTDSASKKTEQPKSEGSSTGTKTRGNSVSNKSAKISQVELSKEEFDEEIRNHTLASRTYQYNRVPVKESFDKESCPICGAEVQPGKNSCDVCGYKFSGHNKKPEQEKKFCRHCGAEVQPEDVFCVECGYEV